MPGIGLGAYFTQCPQDPLHDYYYQHLAGWGNWSFKRSSNFPRVTWQISKSAEVWIQNFLTSEPFCFSLLHNVPHIVLFWVGAPGRRKRTIWPLFLVCIWSICQDWVLILAKDCRISTYLDVPIQSVFIIVPASWSSQMFVTVKPGQESRFPTISPLLLSQHAASCCAAWPCSLER